MRSRPLLAVLSVTVALGLPAGAHAAVTGAVQGTTLQITGDDAADSIVLTGDATNVSLDANADGTPEVSFNRAGFTTVVVAMGGGADTVNAFSVPTDQPLTLEGGPGPDTLLGGAGADTLEGGDGPDVLSGSRGSDSVHGGPGADVLTWFPGEGSDVNSGDEGADRFQLTGSAGAEAFTLGPLSPGTVRLARNIGAITQDLAGFEQLTLLMLGGTDSFIGSAGVAAALADVQVDGGAGADTISGGDERDRISGGLDADILNGGAGDDVFPWSPADTSGDTMDGGPDTDTLDVAGGNGPENYTVSPVPTGFTVGESFSAASISVLAERARIDAQGGDDTVAVAALGPPVEVLGGEGADQLTGGPADDILRGGPGTDRLSGLGGADTLAGDEGEDLLLGGAGPDRFSCSGLGDTLDAAAEDSVDADCLPPVPPPAPAPSGSGTTAPTTASDTLAPGVTVSGLPKTITRAALLKTGLRFSIRTDEPAALSATLLANARSARLAAANLTLASRSFGRAAGTRKLVLRPKAALVGRARSFTLTVRLVATDAAGNQRTVTRTVRVR